MNDNTEFEELRSMTVAMYNREIEEAVISSIFVMPDRFDELPIEPNDFYIHRHRFIFEAYLAAKQSTEYPDIAAIADQLQRNGKLEEIGGPAYLTMLVGCFVSGLGLEENAKRIKDYAARRMLLNQANWISSKALDLEYEVGNIQDQVVIAMSNLQTNFEKSRTMAQVVDDVYADVEAAAKNPSETWGIATGLLDIDRVTGGMHSSETTYLAGAPGSGKSILANQIGAYVAQTEPVWLVSLEMRDKRLVKRLLSAQGEVATRNLSTGYLGTEEWSRFIEACGFVGGLKAHIWDHRGMTLAQFRAEATRLKRLYGIKLIVLDYLYLLAGYENLDMTPRTEVLSSGIQTIAEQLDVHILAINSVVKEGMKGYSSNMADMRGSGQILHDADVVAFISKTSKTATDIELLGADMRLRKLSFEKLRDGDVSDGYEIKLGLTTGYPKFVSTTKPAQPEPQQAKHVQQGLDML